MAGATAVALVLVMALLGATRVSLAATPPTIKVDPVTQAVSPGQPFAVTLRQDADVPTTGAQVDINFDPKLLQLQDFGLAEPYSSKNAIFAFGNTDLGTSANKEAALARANKFGALENVAGFLLPGSGSIAAGSQPFLDLTFVGQPGDGGEAKISLLKGSMIDEAGGPLVPSLAPGTATVAAGSSAVGSPGPAGSGGASPEVSPSAAAAAETPVSPTTPVAVFVAPTSLTLQAGTTARIFLVGRADGDISSVVADLTFDEDKLQVTGIEPGPAWVGATVIAVSTNRSGGVAAAIEEANTTGILQAVGAFFPPGATDVPYGEGVFVSVLVSAKADGTSAISIGNSAALGVSGETIPVTVDASSVTKAPAKGLQLDPTLLVPLVVLAAIVVGVVLAIRSGRIPVRVRRRWPYYVSLCLGLTPVVLFGAIVLTVVLNAAPVVSDPGLGSLVGGQFHDAKGNLVTGFNLLPPLYGTVVITLIAALVGLPISLSLAIAAVDFPMGPLGRLVRPVIGVLSGVPPVVYAVSVPIFVTTFMIPKFAGGMVYDTFDAAAIGADPATWPPAGVPFSAGAFPWTATEANSALLAGVLVGLFLVPFVAPMFVDALANVPRAAREGSLALGANRTYTLRRVVLPRAFPALAGASILAILKAMGDSVIVLFAVGFSAVIADPPFDLLERTATLASWGANLIGSFDTLSASCTLQACAVGYTSALVLLGLAAVIVVGLTVLQGRVRRSVAA